MMVHSCCHESYQGVHLLDYLYLSLYFVTHLKIKKASKMKDSFLPSSMRHSSTDWRMFNCCMESLQPDQWYSAFQEMSMLEAFQLLS